MEIKIQIEQNLISDDIIGTLVSDDTNNIIGDIISYDIITGIAICELYDKTE